MIKRWSPGCKCCVSGCVLHEDQFDRSDSNPPTGKWSVVSGEWEISTERLLNVTEGNIVTTIRQNYGPDSSNYPVIMRFDLIGTGPWKVICRYASESDYDHIEYTKDVSDVVYPAFYASGVLVMDKTTHPGGVGFTWIDSATGVQNVSICYSVYEWTTLPGVGSGNDWTYCEGTPETTLPAGLGVVGFRLGNFDDFQYEQHYEANEDACNRCSCWCLDADDDEKCIPETLDLILTPTVTHAACNPTPAAITYTLTQTQSTATPFDLSPRKYEWMSIPFSTDTGTDWWWRLVCDGHGTMELVLLESGSRNKTVDFNLAQFVLQDGARGGSLTTDEDCLPTIRWDFQNLRKNTLNIGSGGPDFCTPFDAIEYTVRVQE